MSERKVSLLVDGHQCKTVEVGTRVPQESPVLPIVFLVYQSGIFNVVKEELEECMYMSFADNYGLLVIEHVVAQLCERLERVGKKTVNGEEDNHVEFDNGENEAIALTRRKKK